MCCDAYIHYLKSEYCLVTNHIRLMTRKFLIFDCTFQSCFCYAQDSHVSYVAHKDAPHIAFMQIYIFCDIKLLHSDTVSDIDENGKTKEPELEIKMIYR